MKSIVSQITDCIEQIIDKGLHLDKIIIYPCGDVGIQTSNIMRSIYSIEPAIMVDSHKCRYSVNIHDISVFETIDTSQYCLLLASDSMGIYGELKRTAVKYFPLENIVELDSMKNSNPPITTCGRHSYGPLCGHPFVKSVGAFCSFAPGVDVVENHATDYISTHPYIYKSGKMFSMDLIGKNTMITIPVIGFFRMYILMQSN